nr:dorsal-related immunity factor Dif-like [Leptinotarsa decemlineata]
MVKTLRAKELKNTQEELMNAKKNLKLAKCDLKKCSDQVGKLESLLKKRKEEKLDLQAKVSSQEQELLNQASTISSLEEALKMSERNLQNSETNLKTKQEQFSEILQAKPYVKILEEPASKSLRFRYECEGRSTGSIPGVNSTPKKKTFPAIKVEGFQGNAVVVVSCVTKDYPYR